MPSNERLRLTWFLFLLIRDHLPVSNILQIILEFPPEHPVEANATNHYMRMLAGELAERIVEPNV